MSEKIEDSAEQAAMAAILTLQGKGYTYHGGQLWKPPIGNKPDFDLLDAAQATIAEQAKMIEHLRGGPTPLYTAVDMANAARDGFRDGAASKSEPCDGCFMADVEALRKDAALGRVATNYIDRLCDPTESDPLETIVEEYVAAFSAAMSKEG